MMRSRTPWDWRLKLYPFIVIPWIFYVAAGGSLTPSRTPEASGGHSVAAPFNVAGQDRVLLEKHRSQVVTYPVPATPKGGDAIANGTLHLRNVRGMSDPSNVATGAAHPNNAEAQTAAFPDRVCWVDSYPLEYFCFVLTAERG